MVLPRKCSTFIPPAQSWGAIRRAQGHRILKFYLFLFESSFFFRQVCRRDSRSCIDKYVNSYMIYIYVCIYDVSPISGNIIYDNFNDPNHDYRVLVVSPIIDIGCLRR